MTLNIKLVVPNKKKCSGFDLKDIPKTQLEHKR